VSAVNAIVAQLLHLALVLAAAPVAVGLGSWAAARLAGRAAAPVWQPWRDLLRLLRKQSVFAESASGLFEVAPAVAFGASLVAAALVPSFAFGMATASLADLIVLAGLLMLSRAVLALAAMESGTAAGGMGASRAMALAAFTEPALLLSVFPLALLAGTSNLDAIASVLRESALGLRVPLVLAVAALLVVAVARLRGGGVAATVPLAEAAMAEDALAQEYSGRHLALQELSRALRRLVWLGLIADLALPFGLADVADGPLWWLLGAAAWAAKIFVLTLALAVWQAGRVERPGRLAETFGLALLFALLAAAFLFAGQGLA
jgi:formate hydrogenlyase subunit 4